jgi:hypothetical protein
MDRRRFLLAPLAVMLVPSLEFPRCEASDMDVKFVEAGVVTIPFELDFELRLGPS